jgi:hypothetical protein
MAGNTLIPADPWLDRSERLDGRRREYVTPKACLSPLTKEGR